MKNLTYNEWKSTQPEIANSIIYREKDGPENWGVVLCKWKQYTLTKRKVLKHLYPPVINLNTGDVFIQQDRAEILLKFALQVLSRPIHIAFKTAFHALIPFSIPIQILLSIHNSWIKEGTNWKKTRTNAQILNHCLKNSFRSLADIIRTPLYGIVLTIHSLAALIIIPFAWNKAYELMAKNGEIEKALNWNKIHRIGTLFNCFQPYFNIAEIGEIWQGDLSDTKYTSGRMPPTLQPKYNKTLRGLTNFARAQIRDMQKSEDIPKGTKYRRFNKKNHIRIYISNVL